MSNVRIFDPSLVQACEDNIKQACADGSTVTAKSLTASLELDDKDHLYVSACVKRHLSETVGVAHGAGGGFFLKSIERKKVVKVVEVKDLPDGFAADVRSILEGSLAKRTGVSNGFIQGKLEEQYPEVDNEMITRAIRALDGGYKSKPGLGWVRESTEETPSSEGN